MSNRETLFVRRPHCAEPCRSLAVWVCLGALAAGGCDVVSQPPASSADGGQELRESPISSGYRRLRHNFGVLRPGNTSVATFTIKNDSDSIWTFSQIRTSCSCTTGKLSSSVIAPSTAETVQVQYRASNTPGDDSREVCVSFAEEDAPIFVLEVRAQVRNRIHLSRPEIVLVYSASNAHAANAQSVELINYGDDDWTTIDIADSMHWLTAAVSDSTPQGGRQAFTLTVIPNEFARPHSRESGAVVLRVGTNIDGVISWDTVKVPVVISVESPVIMSPSELFIRHASADKETVRIVRLIARQGSSVNRWADITVHHDLESALHCVVMPQSETICEIRCTLTPPKDVPYVCGAIEIRDSRNGWSATVPINARVSD